MSLYQSRIASFSRIASSSGRKLQWAIGPRTRFRRLMTRRTLFRVALENIPEKTSQLGNATFDLSWLAFVGGGRRSFLHYVVRIFRRFSDACRIRLPCHDVSQPTGAYRNGLTLQGVSELMCN